MLKSLSVNNFRNLEIENLKFPLGTTILVGKNGQGKTNILEAIYLLSFGRPFRGTKSDVIKWGQEQATVFGKADDTEVRLVISNQAETKAFINGKHKGMVNLLGNFVCVLFHPEEIEMVTKSPSLRRSWLDRVISTTDRTYLYNLVNYGRILKNRNRLLKNHQGQREQLEVWDRSLARFGAKIWQRRLLATGSINKTIKTESKKIIGKSARIHYLGFTQAGAEEVTETLFLKYLKQTKSLEERLRVTVFGPHRDDFEIILEEKDANTITDKNIADFGSRGEQRQATILLKITEAALFNEHFKAYPTILLDDVTSELDEDNQRLLLNHLYGKQVIITTTDIAHLGSQKGGRNVLKVQGGKVASL